MADTFSEERPLAPTERRLARARRAGEIAVSRDLIASVSLAGACIAMVAGGRAWLGGLVAHVHTALGAATRGNSLAEAVGAAWAAAGAALGWPLAAILAGGILAGLLQTRGALTNGSARRRARWLVSPFGRLLGRERGADLVAGLVKIAVLASVALLTVIPMAPGLLMLPRADAARVMGVALGCGLTLGVRLVIAMVVLGLADCLWRWFRQRSRLRMTYEEVRREHKESEGDPEQKAERRRLHRALEEERALADVREASLLVVEPGLVSAALAWRGSGADAPVVLLWGRGLRARRLAEAARLNAVPLGIDPALARALTSVEEGGDVPDRLLGAAARCLARARGTGPRPVAREGAAAVAERSRGESSE